MITIRAQRTCICVSLCWQATGSSTLSSVHKHELVKVVPDGIYRDIMDLPYVDIDKPWWAAEYIQRANFGEDKRFLIAGDISVEFIRDIDCIYFNKTVYENYHGSRDELYDIVPRGQMDARQAARGHKGHLRRPQ